MNETERIARLRQILDEPGGARAAGVLAGIGDDAAVIDRLAEPLCWSIDCAVEHVHFERAWLDGEALGYRATMAALSDLAAMGARPAGVLASLVLPADVAGAWLEAIARGQRRACDEAATAVIGGNLSRGGELSITTTVLGTASRPMRRTAARAGDRLWLAGEVGLARAGLELLKRGRGDAVHAEQAIRAWSQPRAEIAAGLAAAQVARAAIDISDGLAIDAGRMAEASGVGLVLDAQAIVSDALRAIAAGIALDSPAIDLALYGGEDYALAVACAEPLPAPFRPIGRCGPISAEDKAKGHYLRLESAGGSVPVAARGFDHFE